MRHKNLFIIIIIVIIIKSLLICNRALRQKAVYQVAVNIRTNLPTQWWPSK